MAKARIEFSGDAAELAKAYQQLRDEAIKLTQENVKLARGAKQHHEERKTEIAEEIEGLTKHITHLFTLHGAVQTGIEAYKAWKEEIQELAREAERSHKIVAATIVGVNDATRASEVEEFFETGPASEEDKAAVFRGTKRATSLDLRKEITQAVSEVIAASGGQLFANREQAGQLIVQLKELAPKTDVKDLVDVALRVNPDVLTDTNIRTMRGLVESGATDLKGALALVQGALQRQVPEKILETIASKVEEPGDAPTHVRGRRLTEQERFTQQLSDMTPAERLKALRTNKEMQRALGFGDKAITQLGALDEETIATQRRRIEEADREDFRLKAAEPLKQTEAGAAEIAAYRGDVGLEAARRKEELLARLHAEADKFIEERGFATKGPVGRFVNNSLFSWAPELGALLSTLYLGKQAGPESRIVHYGYGSQKELKEWRERTQELYRMLELQEKQVQLQEENNELLRRSTEPPIPPPADASAHRE